MKFSEEPTKTFEERLKLMFFSAYNSLIGNNVTYRIVYILFLFIEFIEILSYILPASSDEYITRSSFLYSALYYIDVDGICNT